LVAGSRRTDLGHISGSREAQGSSGPVASRRRLEFVFRITGDSPSVMVTISSEKGGFVQETIPLTGN
jgi:hypothetical protein